MNSRTTPRGIAKMATAGALGLSMALTLAMPAFAVGDPDLRPEQTSTSTETPQDVLTPAMLEAQGNVAVFVQFKGKGAFESTQPESVLNGSQEPVAAQAQVQEIARTVESQASQAAAQASSDILYTTHNSVRGVAIQGDADAIKALADRSDVEKISPIIAKYPSNGSADVLTNTLNTWVQTGYTGKDVTIAVVDSGLDYTHAAFGGPGTQEAYEEASASTNLPAADSGLYDTAKFIGGYDLAGDNYDARDPNKPAQPDSNPLDCRAGGHGTHVAGTAVGYGVDAEGNTFRGDYSTLTAGEVEGMKVGPGSAPEAKVAAYRVFGCSGSTNLTGAALDMTLDPNGDGDFSDRANIVNLSLGSDFGVADDPETTIIDALARQGVLSVIAAGNANGYNGVGDTYSILGTPGNSVSALTVANSIGANVYADKARVTAPEDITGDVRGDYSVNFNYSSASKEQLSGTVVAAPESNKFACNAFGDDVNFEGKWVYISWEDAPNTFPCGSAARFNNIEKAGGKGVVLASALDVEQTGIAGNSTIPGVRLSKDDAAKVEEAAKAGTLQIELNADWIDSVVAPSGKTDQLNTSSSRGQHGTNGFTKPDVAAPGTNIGSAGVGQGNGMRVMTGTSMASPHVAGIAALVLEANQSYTPQNIKAAIMNTATHDITNTEGDVYSVERTGSGRVDALAAVNEKVFLYNSDRNEQVSTSFGVTESLPTDGVLTLTRDVTLENRDSKSHTYQASVNQSSTVPGVSFSVPSTVTVNPGQKAKVTVTVTVDPSKLEKVMDPATETMQRDAAYGVDRYRQYIAEASGRLVLTEGNSELRIPVQIAPKPISDVKVEGDFGSLTNADSTTKLEITGTGLDQGGYTSMLGAFQLGATSERIKSANFMAPSSQTADLQYVGANSTAPVLAANGGNPNSGVLSFGISTWANWDIVSPTSSVQISIDTDGNNIADYYLVTQRQTGLDFPVAKLFGFNNGSLVHMASYAINGAWGNVDTNQMNTNTMVLPVPLAHLGLSAANARDISYKVDTSNWYVNGSSVDSTDWITYNPFAPGVWFEGDAATSVLFKDLPGANLVAHSNGSAESALFLHMHNASGDLTGNVIGEDGGKAQVVKFADHVSEEKPNPMDEGVVDPHFVDVKKGDTFYKEIAWLSSRGITKGWSDGTFRPYSSTERGQMAAFFYRMAGSPQYTAPSTSPFSDVPTTHVFYKEISWMHSQGITKGWDDGTFRPNAPVNRDVMAAFFYRMAGSPSYNAPSTSPFSDVPTTHVFYKEISWMHSQEIAKGWDDGTYRPYTPVTREAMAAFIYRYTEHQLGL